MLVKMAVKNLLARKAKSLIIGSIVFTGTLISSLGSNVVDAIIDGLRTSITQSIAGDVQIYSANAKEDLSVFGSVGGDFPDIGQISDIHSVRTLIMEKVEGIKAIVPQGINVAMQNPGNILDRYFARLRASNFASDAEQATFITHIRTTILRVGEEYRKNISGIIASSQEDIDRNLLALERALSEDFWNDFAVKREDSMEFLENQIAPLIHDETMVFFFYVGADPQEMMNAFPLIEIVSGNSIAEGESGILLNEFVYETQMKHKTAVRLDQIKKALSKQGRRIADDTELQDLIRINVERINDLLFELTPLQLANLKGELQTLLKQENAPVENLLKTFFNMDDEFFLERYAFFYQKIAPKFDLYRINIGDPIPLTSFAKNGFSRAKNLIVRGIFRFRGLEGSPTSGSFSLIDMASFQQLYGYVTEAQREEMLTLDAEMSQFVSFGDTFDHTTIEDMFIDSANPPPSAESSPKMATTNEAKAAPASCQNAAIILDNPNQTGRVVEAINRLAKEQNLAIQARPWFEVAGLLGQMAFVFGAVLWGLVFIIYFIAIFIIMNSILMATLDRTKEIGTIRAIGGPKNFIIQLVLLEITLTALFFGTLGAITATLITMALQYHGIPVQDDAMTFFFSGSSLHPAPKLTNALISIAASCGICLVATLFPLSKAASIPPAVAMRRD